MKKRIVYDVYGTWQRLALLACLLFFVSGSLSAQRVEKVKPINSATTESTDVWTSNLKRHWFIGGGIGPRIYYGDHNGHMNIIDRPSIGGEVYGGKWWSPVIGTRIGYSLQNTKGLADTGPNNNFNVHSTGEAYGPYNPPEGERPLYVQKFNVGHLYGDVLLNISNLVLGYQQERLFSLSFYAGMGWMRTWDQPQASEISAGIGLFNTFRLSDAVDLTLDLRGTTMDDRFDGEAGGRSKDGIFSANLGLIYTFGDRAWTRPVDPATIVQLNERITEMVGENAQLRTQLNQAEQETANTNTVVKRVTEWKDIVTDVYIRFTLGKSDLSKDARIQLGFLADLLKKYPEGSYTITGYADEGTGTSDINIRLSKARAESVKNYLTKEFGIASSRLQAVAAGGIENRYFDDPALSRSVVIRPNK